MTKSDSHLFGDCAFFLDIWLLLMNFLRLSIAGMVLSE